MFIVHKGHLYRPETDFFATERQFVTVYYPAFSRLIYSMLKERNKGEKQ